ncbi:Succinyl-CoA ligase [GDP-forming] subunit beta, mitochondrial [Thelohanellus kitauei]|uniref:Succinate-CoA ligase subunit beta n=1 Tax=Thelohanellus kitauei TaxID=669202 RepID=A0A0C2MBA1_THEKT|nr:Succinyl-CoA ligase [GDP-forming] subunit beta, mitochondrial [Thelohanellus kitauei]
MFHNLVKGNFKLVQRRFLNLQEYQCKNILAENSLTIQRFGVATDPESALRIAKDLSAVEYVIKAQILAGGRGKGVFTTGFKGGVHLTKNINEIPKIVSSMLGNRLITKQTSSEGVLVNKVTVCEALDIVNETYIAVLLDPGCGLPVLVGSPCGGMDIEEVARKSPEKIYKMPIDIETGLRRDQCVDMARKLEFPPKDVEEAGDQIMKLYNLLLKLDATQIEINPFGVASNSKVVCFDSKINFDDNAQFRQQKVFNMEDFSETPILEYEALKAGLTYIELDGDIGCLVNGAGLAMATLDIVKLYGGEPSNFLDLGGTADENRVLTALNIFSKDTRVKNIFINIFGGIVDCRIIARGIADARKRIKQIQPIVMRLQGNNNEAAKKLIEELNDPCIIMIDDFDKAAKKACQIN